MHVVLVGAEFEENLAVRYLRGALEHAGHRVTSVVFNDAADTERAAAEIAGCGAQLAGYSMVFTYRAREFACLAARARQLGFAGHATAGGHFAAFNAEALLHDVPAFDSVAGGEGEELLCRLAASGADPRAIDGLVWRDGDRLVRNPPARNPSDLDTLPYPPRKGRFDCYVEVPITNILSSRGCSRSCAFCSIAAWHKACGGERLRLRAPEHVAEEMAWLAGQGVRIFNFHDDNFVLDDRDAMRRRMGRLRGELRRRGVTDRIAFAIKCRPDVVEKELFRELKAMGLFRVFLGVEAGTERALRQLGRGQTVGQNEQALAILNELDVHTCFNLLMLNPDSTLEDFSAQVGFLRAHPHNAMNFCRTEIYAGTPWERRLREQGRLLGDYWGWDYVIADPRAQALFELVYPAFESRNYGDEGLHHLTMQIDYEQQLLRHFFGPHERLRARVKGLIAEVNHNTCKHLEGVVRYVAQLQTEGQRTAFAAELRGNVHRDNAVLGERVQSVLDEIRIAPSRTRRAAGRAWVRTAVSAGLAATVGLGAAACRERSHPTEMIAVPPASTQGPPPPQPDDASVDDASRDAEQETGSQPADAGADVRVPRLRAVPQRVPPRPEMAPRPPPRPEIAPKPSRR